jgi:NTE family protein
MPGPLATGPSYGPDLQSERAVVLVLGPGLARGYAYTGVIRALSDAKIKIGAIVGTEMGALVGALYGLDGSVNKLEWGMQHFRDDVFASDTSVFSKLLSAAPGEKLDASLAQVFGDRDASSAKVPLKILIQPAGGGAKVVDHGALRLLVRAAISNSDGIPPIFFDGAPSGTAAALRPFDVQDAKALGLGPVVVVNVLDSKESDLFPEMKEADLVLQPEVGAISKTDFLKRTDAVFAGKAVTEAHLEEIKRLIGAGAPR